jgi:RES domain-containing protein
MLVYSDLLVAIAAAPRVTIHGPWARCIEYALLQGPPPGRPRRSRPQPLWPGGSVLSGARFTPVGSFSTLYLASDFATAQTETGSVFSHAALANTTIATEPVVTFAVDGVLTDVIDFHDPTAQALAGTTTSELTGSWQLATPAPTQELGRAAFDSGVITALKYPSSKRVGGWGLAVFVDRLTLNTVNFIEIVDKTLKLKQRLP